MLVKINVEQVNQYQSFELPGHSKEIRQEKLTAFFLFTFFLTVSFSA